MAFTLDELYNMREHGNETSQSEQNDAHFESTEANEATETDTQSAAEPAATTVAQEPLSVAGADLLRVRELEASLQEANAEMDVLRDRLNTAKAANGAPDPFQEEMIELLRTEMTQLQTEVTERDILIQELRGGDTGSVATDDDTTGVSADELQKLCTRLEELLSELDQKDDQLTVLQNHLQISEDATHAEQDERRQLENWVEEIESRITARDRDWELKLSEMSVRLTQARSERRAAEQSASSDSNDTRIEALQRVVTDLRDEKDELLSQLDKERETIQDLQRAVENASEDAERLESVQLCQERADVARQRFELEKLKQELEDQKAMEGSDLRIRALRDHLKEVQATEEEERQEAYEKSLAGRVSRLWKRLDKR
jgi:chromosome segregation ATPase